MMSLLWILDTNNFRIYQPTIEHKIKNKLFNDNVEIHKSECDEKSFISFNNNKISL